MILKTNLPALFLLLFVCCTNKQTETVEAEVKKQSVPSSSPVLIETDADDRTSAESDSTLQGVDTLYNMLAKMNAVVGTFVDASLLTEDFIDAGMPESERKFMAYLIQSGEGEYGGLHEGIDFESVYSVLVVLEERDDDLYYITHRELAISSSARLIRCSLYGEEFKLSNDKYGVLIHNNSSEEGAGDYGFRKDEAELYVLMGNTIEKVFQSTLDDFTFSSNEIDSYAQQTITTVLSALDTKTNGLFDLQTITTTSSNSSVEEETTGHETTEENENPVAVEDEGDDGIDIYKWSGTAYALVEE